MNEFIAWDENDKRFYSFNLKELYDEGCETVLSSDSKHLGKYNVFPYDGMGIFNYIDKTDIDGNKIYADCSIVEFEYISEKQIGVFIYSNSISGYKIRVSKKDTWDEWLNINYNDMKNFKVIGTLQQDKHLLKDN